MYGRSQVGNHQTKGPPGARKIAVDQVDSGCRLGVLLQVQGRSIDSGTIDVNGKDLQASKGCRSQRQNAGAAPGIESPRWDNVEGTPGPAQQLIQQPQSKTGARMAPVSKGLQGLDEERFVVFANRDAPAD